MDFRIAFPVDQFFVVPGVVDIQKATFPFAALIGGDILGGGPDNCILGSAVGKLERLKIQPLCLRILPQKLPVMTAIVESIGTLFFINAVKIFALDDTAKCLISQLEPCLYVF